MIIRAITNTKALKFRGEHAFTTYSVLSLEQPLQKKFSGSAPGLGSEATFLHLLYTHNKTARHIKLSSAHVCDVKCNDPLNKLYFQSSMNQSVSTELLFPAIFYVCLYVIVCGHECS